jgi:metal-responsive CopG/Arc/MetJ family transcriptional regulator
MEAKTLKISLPKDVLDTIDKDLELLRNTESERIQNIVISSILLNSYKTNSDKHTCYEYNNDLHVLEYMIDSID